MTENNKITNIGIYNIKKPIVDNRNNVHTLPSRIRQDQAYRSALFSVQNLKKKPSEDKTRAMFLLFSTCINRSDDIVLTESVYLSSVYGFCHR